MITKTRRVKPGFEWSIGTGYSTDKNGTPERGTEDRIVKGWAPTREQAREDMEKKAEELQLEEEEDE